MLPKPITFNSIVIGSGPSGVAIVANLINKQAFPILWIDPTFTCGRLSKYMEVPSNTKVKHFLQYATTLPVLREIANDPEMSHVQHLRGLDPESTCSLSFAAEMVEKLKNSMLKKFEQEITAQKGFVSKLSLFESVWKVNVEVAMHELEFECHNVFLATGSHPKILSDSDAVERYAKDCHVLNLDIALSPSHLSDHVDKNDIVAVVGSSHSAMLALKNLDDLEEPPKKILNFYRHPLKYAVYMDNWILYDNTGLKGEVAVWAKDLLEPEKIERIQRIQLTDGAEGEIYSKEIKNATKLIYSIGYQRNPLPEIIVNTNPVASVKLLLDNSGRLAEQNDTVLPGMYGFGIAFPEKTVDRYGNKEEAVGLAKFMRYISAVFEKIKL